MTSTTELVERATGQLRSFGSISENVGKDLLAHVTTLERELEEARAANKALMDERTNLIETKRQQITASQAQVERLKAELAATEAYWGGKAKP